MNHKNYIRTMFEATRDGMLTLTHYPEDGSEEFDRTYPVNWDSQTAEALEKQFDKLRGHLDHIGLLHDELQAFIQQEKVPRSILNGELLTVWDTYIAPFGDSGLDDDAVADADTKRFCGDELTEEEEALLKQYDVWIEQQCLQRLPHLGCTSVYLINRARRYEKLVSLGAPKIILENEAQRLAEEMVLYYCMAK